jgi:transposase
VPKTKTNSGCRAKSRPKTRWTREFKLQALSRMDEAPDITALARELGLERKLLYIWRDKYRSGGPEALNAIGRPAHAPELLGEALPDTSPLTADGNLRRIAELERKIGQQQLELDFFRAALRHVREARLKKGGSGETASSR